MFNVMWMKVGMVLKLFDDVIGEWVVEVVVIVKCDIMLLIMMYLCLCELVFDLWLGVVFICCV